MKIKIRIDEEIILSIIKLDYDLYRLGLRLILDVSVLFIELGFLFVVFIFLVWVLSFFCII